MTTDTQWGGAAVGVKLVEMVSEGLPQTAIDNILKALESVTGWEGKKTVKLTRANAAPSIAGVKSCSEIMANGANDCITN